MGNFSFQRVNDNIYRAFVKAGDSVSSELFLSYKGISSEESYQTANKVADLIISGKIPLSNQKIPFEYKGRKFIIEQDFLRKRDRFAKYLTAFFKLYRNSSKIQVKISEDSSTKGLALGDVSPSLKIQEKPPVMTIAQPAFLDGYTKLAAEAFQKYESEFAAHDHPKSAPETDHSEYRIVKNGDVLELVHAKDYQEAGGETLRAYYSYLVRQYGSKKIDYVAHLYRINLQTGPLTPEIVYRMNIGLGNLEKQDVDTFVKKVEALNLNEDATLFDQFNLHELRGIKRLISPDKNLSYKDLYEWIEQFQSQTLSTQLKEAISILSFQPEERSRQYTGREIVYPISGRYTIADRKYYKPWVDQQELLQTFSKLEKSSNWDHYYETLAHIICKKHLVRNHPTNIYQVGALIPAPADRDGNPRWYAVTSCISNGRGIYSYTLEPLDPNDSSLPAIKLFRNTSSGNYAFDSKATLRNDLNPINSPGYEGSEMTREYEKEFIESRTIPLWVAYRLQAFEEMKKSDANPEKIHAALAQSIQAYRQDVIRLYQPPLAKEIISRRDAELIDLAQNLIKDSLFNLANVFKLISIFFRYKNSSKISPKEQEEDCRFILSLIKDKKSVSYKALQHDLERSLGSHFDQQKFKKRMNGLDKLEILLKNKNYKAIDKVLNQLAINLGEHPDQKIHQPVMIVGHSLGGACAQKFYVDYTANNARVPLADMEIGIRTFDPPAINQHDNEIYKDYGRHHALFKELGMKFSVVHKMEAGDFVAQAGEEHVGAASDAREQYALYKWSRFEASVTQGIESSSVASIRDPRRAHSTRFEEGKRNPSFLIGVAKDVLSNPFLPKKVGQKIRGIVAERLGDYERIWVDPQTLSRFDHGNEKAWAQIQKVWKEFGLKSHYIEKGRALLGVIFRILLYKSSLNQTVEEQDAGHGEWWKYRDEKGVFAVNLDGIRSLKDT